jgi:hypothetical protein
MAKLVFGMNQSLDGYVDHMAFAPSPTLFRHFIEQAQGQAGSPSCWVTASHTSPDRRSRQTRSAPLDTGRLAAYYIVSRYIDNG